MRSDSARGAMPACRKEVMDTSPHSLRSQEATAHGLTGQETVTAIWPMLIGVLRRWKFITVIALWCLLAAFGLLQTLPTLYKASVDVLIFDPQQQIQEEVQKQVSPFKDIVDLVAINTELEVIKSKSLALRVATE